MSEYTETPESPGSSASQSGAGSPEAAEPSSTDVRAQCRGRDLLRAAALRLFTRKGYAATSVRDILRDAGVSAPVLYHHFGNKEGLFLELVREGRERAAAARARALSEGGTARERILRVALALAEIRRQHAGGSWVVEALISGPPDAAPDCDFRALARESAELFEQLVAEGITAGEFAAVQPATAALTLMGVLEVAARPHLWPPDRGDEAERTRRMFEIVLTGLAIPPPKH